MIKNILHITQPLAQSDHLLDDLHQSFKRDNIAHGLYIESEVGSYKRYSMVRFDAPGVFELRAVENSKLLTWEQFYKRTSKWRK